MYLIFKRFLDIVISMIAIILFSPFLAIIIIILKFSGEGEVFYLQERVGYKNKKFKIFKFATMVKNSSKIGSRDVTIRNDPRVTLFGKYLRKSKLNEVPQLFNILKGDITIIGPRPLMMLGFNRYSKDIQKNIYKIKPGLTGLGSIFFRDEEKIISNSDLPPNICYKKIILPYKGELEKWYQKNQNIKIDTYIIILTLIIILINNHNIIFTLINDLPKPSKKLKKLYDK